MPDDKIRRPDFRYIDVPELMETFADSIGPWSFDGSTLRLEFLVSRLDRGKPSEPPSGRRLPVCRLVLGTKAAVELLNFAQQLAAALKKAGVLKAAQTETAPPKAN